MRMEMGMATTRCTLLDYSGLEVLVCRRAEVRTSWGGRREGRALLRTATPLLALLAGWLLVLFLRRADFRFYTYSTTTTATTFLYSISFLLGSSKVVVGMACCVGICCT